MKTSELIGPALDWAVAKCEEVTLSEHIDGLCSWLEHEVIGFWHVYSPSTDWAQGGPIIGREHICSFFYSSDEDGNPCKPGWEAFIHADGIHCYGDTQLIATMRCFVASKLGNEIEIPEDLK